MFSCPSSVAFTSEAIWHICFEHDVAEDGWQRQGLVALIPKGDMPVSCLETIQRQYPLANQLVVIVVNSYPQDSKVWENHLGGPRTEMVIDGHHERHLRILTFGGILETHPWPTESRRGPPSPAGFALEPCTDDPPACWGHPLCLYTTVAS